MDGGTSGLYADYGPSWFAWLKERCGSHFASVALLLFFIGIYQMKHVDCKSCDCTVTVNTPIIINYYY